jgi:hypothetical protein
MSTITRTVVLIDTSCVNCGIAFAVPDWWIQARRDDGKDFWCPNGHRLHFGQNTLEQRLARAEQARDAARAHARAVQDQNDAERRAHAATKGQLTKTRKRVAAGVCPCCNRSFQNLRRHMAGQHPDYATAGTQ